SPFVVAVRFLLHDGYALPVLQPSPEQHDLRVPNSFPVLVANHSRDKRIRVHLEFNSIRLNRRPNRDGSGVETVLLVRLPGNSFALGSEPILALLKIAECETAVGP